VDALETANLNHSEIQKLVDVLLDKQKSADQWKTVSLLFASGTYDSNVNLFSLLNV
jgi:hypothetical protein